MCTYSGSIRKKRLFIVAGSVLRMLKLIVLIDPSLVYGKVIVSVMLAEKELLDIGERIVGESV